MTAKLYAIDPHKKRREAVRGRLAGAIKELARDRTLAGFALVVWDTRGAIGSSLCTMHGPLARCSVPNTVRDALLRHNSVDMAHDEIMGVPPTDAGA